MEEKYVWPWVGVVANIPTEFDERTRLRVGKSGSSLRDELTLKGFNPTRVQPLWNFKGHSGFALVEFNKDFQGFENAMRFEKSYQLESHGKRDWQNGIHFRDDKLYGWVAREDDYNGNDVVGKYIKKKRDLKSISKIEEEEKTKMKRLVESLSHSIEMKKELKQVLEEKVNENNFLIESLILQNIESYLSFKQEIEEMQANVRELYEEIMQGHEKSMLEVDTKREMLEERARRIELKKKAIWEQNVANEEAIKLLEKYKEEKETILKKIMEIEVKLIERQELELEIEKLKGDTNVMKHMVGSDVDVDFVDKITKTQIELRAKELALQEKMRTLTQKERVTNNEYQEVRKVMIKFWYENNALMNEEIIKIKRLGQLDPKPFLVAMKKKHKGSSSRQEKKAMELCSWWDKEIVDVQWYPFKIDESDGTPKRVVDKNDEKLLKLKYEYGEEVYNEVLRAKEELEDNNASGSYVISELWNYEKKRMATIEEATDVMLRMLDLAGNKNKRIRL